MQKPQALQCQYVLLWQRDLPHKAAASSSTLVRQRCQAKPNKSNHNTGRTAPALCAMWRACTLPKRAKDSKPAKNNTKSALGVVCTARMCSIMPAWLSPCAACAGAPPEPISACARGIVPAQGWDRSTASHWRPTLLTTSFQRLRMQDHGLQRCAAAGTPHG